MKTSLNYLNKFLDFDLKAIPINEIESIVGAQLGALEEETLALGNLYDNIIVVEVVKADPIEGSDHLNFCLIDDGGVYSKADTFRNDDGTIGVVCGAPNVTKGIKVAWIAPGAIVPISFFKEPFIIESREIFSHISNGMLASGHELFVNNDSSGLLILDSSLKKGTPIKDVLELDDQVLDIENKMFTHRPDCFGLVGVARELAGIMHKKFKSPSWYKTDDLKLSLNKKVKYDLKIQIENKDLTKRFTALILSNVKIGPSPIKVQSYLIRQGIKPINNVVDATNLVMLETSQPMHAYDLKKILSIGNKVELCARQAKANEKLTLLNSKEVILNPNNIVISSNNKAVALAGVMGGQDTEIDQDTTEIILESANFDMYSIRRTSMSLGIFSDSVTRFNKGQSPFQTKLALFRLAELIKEFSNSEVALSSEVVDLNLINKDDQKNGSISKTINIDIDFINDRLGTKLDSKNVTRLLENVEFKVKSRFNSLNVKPPFYRTDIEIKEDLVEEVGRLYGYQHIKLKPIKRNVSVAKISNILELKKQSRLILTNLGLNEVISYSYYSLSDLESNNLDKDNSFEITNPLSPELKYFRQNITSSMVSKIHPNIKLGFYEFGLYEFGQIFIRAKSNFKVENSFNNLAIIYANQKDNNFSSYYNLKKIYKEYIKRLHLTGFEIVKTSEYKGEIDSYIKAIKAPYNPNLSALIISRSNQVIGIMGEFSQKTLKGYKLPRNSGGIELNLELLSSQPNSLVYFPTTKFPINKQDLTLKVPSKTTYQELKDSLIKEFELLKQDNIALKTELISIFRPSSSLDFKNVTFRLYISDLDRTLSDEYVNSLLDKLVLKLKDKLKVERI